MILIAGQSNATRDDRERNDRQDQKWFDNANTSDPNTLIKIDLGHHHARQRHQREELFRTYSEKHRAVHRQRGV
jgi:hypothetical protein